MNDPRWATIAGFKPLYWEMWATFCVLRTLGFIPDQIFAVVGKDGRVGSPTFGKPVGCIELRAQKLKYNIICGELPHDHAAEGFSAEWTRFSEELASGKLSEELLGGMFDGSLACLQKVPLINGLIDKGFRLPLGSD